LDANIVSGFKSFRQGLSKFGAPERKWTIFGGPRSQFQCIPAQFNHWLAAINNRIKQFT